MAKPKGRYEGYLVMNVVIGICDNNVAYQVLE